MFKIEYGELIGEVQIIKNDSNKVQVKVKRS